MHSEPGGVVEGGRRGDKYSQSREGSQTHSEPGGVVEGARRAAKRTHSREECRRAGGQPNTLIAAKHIQCRREWWRGTGGQLSTLRARGNGGVERKGSQAHSEPGGVVEGGGRAAKHTQSREEWWRGAGGQPSTHRAGWSGGGGREGS